MTESHCNVVPPIRALYRPPPTDRPPPQPPPQPPPLELPQSGYYNRSYSVQPIQPEMTHPTLPPFRYLRYLLLLLLHNHHHHLHHPPIPPTVDMPSTPNIRSRRSLPPETTHLPPETTHPIEYGNSPWNTEFHTHVLLITPTMTDRLLAPNRKPFRYSNLQHLQCHLTPDKLLRFLFPHHPYKQIGPAIYVSSHRLPPYVPLPEDCSVHTVVPPHHVLLPVYFSDPCARLKAGHTKPLYYDYYQLASPSPRMGYFDDFDDIQPFCDAYGILDDDNDEDEIGQYLLGSTTEDDHDDVLSHMTHNLHLTHTDPILTTHDATTTNDVDDTHDPLPRSYSSLELGDSFQPQSLRRTLSGSVYYPTNDPPATTTLYLPPYLLMRLHQVPPHQQASHQWLPKTQKKLKCPARLRKNLLKATKSHDHGLTIMLLTIAYHIDPRIFTPPPDLLAALDTPNSFYIFVPSELLTLDSFIQYVDALHIPDPRPRLLMLPSHF